MNFQDLVQTAGRSLVGSPSDPLQDAAAIARDCDENEDEFFPCPKCGNETVTPDDVAQGRPVCLLCTLEDMEAAARKELSRRDNSEDPETTRIQFTPATAPLATRPHPLGRRHSPVSRLPPLGQVRSEASEESPTEPEGPPKEPEGPEGVAAAMGLEKRLVGIKGCILQMVGKRSGDSHCSVEINGEEVVFGHKIDHIGASSTQVLSSVWSSNIPVLYWYIPCAGIVTQKTFLLEMCAIEGTEDVLVSIWGTRCNRTRYDFVIYRGLSDSCDLVLGTNGAGTRIKMEPDRRFDRIAVENAFQTYVHINKYNHC